MSMGCEAVVVRGRRSSGKMSKWRSCLNRQGGWVYTAEGICVCTCGLKQYVIDLGN